MSEVTPAGKTDVEILRELDWRHETPCTWRTLQVSLCEKPARWAFVCKVCARTYVLCDEHHKHNVVNRTGRRWLCRECDTVRFGLFSLYHVVPFGRS